MHFDTSENKLIEGIIQTEAFSLQGKMLLLSIMLSKPFNL